MISVDIENFVRNEASAARCRILFLVAGPQPPSANQAENKFAYLSEYFSGDIVGTSWYFDGDDFQEKHEEIARACGKFNYYPLKAKCVNFPLIRPISQAIKYLICALKVARRSKPNVVVAYGPFVPGVVGVLVKFLLGVKLVVELPGNPQAAYRFDDEKMNFSSKIKSAISLPLTKFVCQFADALKLLYPEQSMGICSKSKTLAVFHDFVPVNYLSKQFTANGPVVKEKTVLFLGHPWHLKGVDILIKAFVKIASEFSDWQLQVEGYCLELEKYRNFCGNCDQISFGKGRTSEEVRQLMSRASVFVLPSRTEAMGRVLLEAMANRCAIIASNVDGIPHYIEDGKTGLLFETESIDGLAEKLRSLLGSEKRSEFVEEGVERVLSELGEEEYCKKYLELLSLV